MIRGLNLNQRMHLDKTKGKNMANLPINFPFPAERDKANNIKVRADHFDANMEFLIGLINNALSRFGANKIQGNIDANNKTFKNLATPVESGDAATKQYADSLFNTIVQKNPLLTPALLQLATQDETLAGIVTGKAVSPATLALAVSSAISASATNLPYGFRGGFGLSYSNNVQITIGTGQCTSSDNTRNMITTFVANKDITTLWAPSDGASAVVGCRPAAVPINVWSRYNIFAISTEPQPATHGSFTTGDISANVDNFKGVSDGFVRVVVDSVNRDLTGLDFSTITTLEDIAAVIKNALTGADCNAVGNTLVITSNATGATSTINLATISGAVGTDITTTNLLNVSGGTATAGKNYVYSVVDFGIDQGNNYSASNLLAESDSAYKAGFRNYRYLGYLIVGANNQIISIKGANDEETFNKMRQSYLPDFCTIQPSVTPSATNFWTYQDAYFPCVGDISIGKVGNLCFAYWGTDGVRRFMLPDDSLWKKLQNSAGQGIYGSVSITDSTSGASITTFNLPNCANGKIITENAPVISANGNSIYLFKFIDNGQATKISVSGANIGNAQVAAMESPSSNVVRDAESNMVADFSGYTTVLMCIKY